MSREDRESLRKRLQVSEVTPAGGPQARWNRRQEFHLVAIVQRELAERVARGDVGRKSEKKPRVLPNGRSNKRLDDLIVRIAEARAPERSVARSTWNRAAKEAAADLKKLGLKGSTSELLGYLDRFVAWTDGPFEVAHWGLPDQSEAALQREFDRAKQQAIAEDLSLLPNPTSLTREPGRWHTKAVSHSASSVPQAWDRICTEIVRVRLQHSSALAARRELIRLRKAEEASGLPSAEIYFERLGESIQRLLTSSQACDREFLGALVGGCAAEASHWRMRVLTWRLELAALELRPRGDYSAGRNPPRQLGVLDDLEAQLWSCLAQGTSNAKSVSVAAAMKVFAGPELTPPIPTKTYARNSIVKRARERSRRKAAPALAR